MKKHIHILILLLSLSVIQLQAQRHLRIQELKNGREYKSYYQPQTSYFRYGLKGSVGRTFNDWVRPNNLGYFPGTNVPASFGSRTNEPTYELGLVVQHTSSDNFFAQYEVVAVWNNTKYKNSVLYIDDTETNRQISSAYQVGGRINIAVGKKFPTGQTSNFLLGAYLSGTYGIDYNVNTEAVPRSTSNIAFYKDVDAQYYDLGLGAMLAMEAGPMQLSLNAGYQANLFGYDDKFDVTNCFSVKFGLTIFFLKTAD